MDFNKIWATVAVYDIIENEILTMRMGRSKLSTIFETYRSLCAMFRKDVQAMKSTDSELPEDISFEDASMLLRKITNAADIKKAQIVYIEFKSWVRRELKGIEEGKSAQKFLHSQRIIVEKRELLIQYLTECHDRAAPFADLILQKEEKFLSTMNSIHLEVMHQAALLIRANFQRERHQLLSSACDLCFLKNKSAEKVLHSIVETFASEANNLRNQIYDIEKQIHNILLDYNTQILMSKKTLADVGKQIVTYHVTITEELTKLEILTTTLNKRRRAQAEKQITSDDERAKMQAERDWWLKKVERLRKRTALQYVAA